MGAISDAHGDMETGLSGSVQAYHASPAVPDWRIGEKSVSNTFMKKKKIKIIIPVVGAVIVGVLFFYLLAGNHAATDEARAALSPTESVTVEDTGSEIIFTPAENPEGTGFVFYPGGKVDAEAYAYLARGLAERGILSVIVKMPFDLAVFNSNGAKGVLEGHPEIRSWYIGGHSLGGVMASGYAAKDERILGVAFLASYPNSDLSGSGLRALSLTAANDGVLNREKYEEALPLFPADTVFYDIEGGNHAGFGSYGAQDGDGAASISPAAQQDIAVGQIMEWIRG